MDGVWQGLRKHSFQARLRLTRHSRHAVSQHSLLAFSRPAVLAATCLPQPWGVDSSAKLSPFLAVGCLSPRMIHWEVLRLAAAEQAAGGEACAGATAAAAEQAAGATKGAAAGAAAVGPGAAAGAAGSAAAGSAAGGASTRAVAPPAWREPQKGDTWRWLIMHLGIRDWFILSAMQNEAGALGCCASLRCSGVLVGMVCSAVACMLSQ